MKRWIAAGLTISIFVSIALLAQRDDHGWKLLLWLMPLAAFPALLAVRDPGRWLPSLGWIFGVGIVVRAIFLLPDPLLSDDAYRYIWDGRVQVAGHLPYGLAPDATELDAVESTVPGHQQVRSLVNHPDLPTIYPPLLQELFAGCVLVARPLEALGAPPLLAWRLLLCMADLALAGAIVLGLRGLGRDPREAVLYLWHPLPVLEGIWSAHVETVAVALATAGLVFLARGRTRWAGVLLGLGGAAKLLPFAWFPYLLRRVGRVPVALGLLVAVLTVLPYLAVDLGEAVASLRNYGESWYFNDMTFHLTGAILGIDVEDRTLASTQLLRCGLMASFACVAIAIAIRPPSPYRAGWLLAVVFVVLTPTLHPWYVLWLLPFAILARSPGGILLATTVLLAHQVPLRVHGGGGSWEGGVPVSIRIAEFGVPAVLLAMETVRWLRSSREPGASGGESRLLVR